MEYVIEVDENKNILKETWIDEYGNEDVVYSEDDERYKGFNFTETIKGVILNLKLQLRLNKTLYEESKISKELYEKIENLILERLQPFEKYIEEV